MLLGENWCWTLLEAKGFKTVHFQQLKGMQGFNYVSDKVTICQ